MRADSVTTAGEFRGTNRLWLDPTQPPDESAIELSVSSAVGGACVMLRYTWSYGGEPKEGMIMVAPRARDGAESVAWIDSFHTGGTMMVLRAEAASDDRVVALGSYAAPTGPDWGWRMAIEFGSGTVRVIMHNITPDGDEAIAVDAEATAA